jgi:ABC-2 type transport system ATP-binding protein
VRYSDRMAHDRTGPAIQTIQLTRRYDSLVAVDHLEFGASAGSIFGLLGPNGAGKSTLIKMLTTLLPPTSGTAWVAGYDIVRKPADVRRNIGYVAQMLSADGDLTGYENLLISAKLYGIRGQDREIRIAEALEFMSLTEAAGKRVKQYSGGMIRRLEIAQSMLHRPEVLFLDEPTIGLDPVAKRSVWDHIRELREHDSHDHPRHGGGGRVVRYGGHYASGSYCVAGNTRRVEGRGRPRGHAERRVHSLHGRGYYG